MAQSDKIVYTDIIEKDFLANPTKSAEEFNLALLDLAEGFKVVQKEATIFLKANQNPKTAEELKKVNAEIDRSVKSRKALSEVEKQLTAIQKQNEALQKKLLALENAKDKAKKESAKSTKQLTDAEKVQSQLEAKANRDRIKYLQAEAILLDSKAGKEAKINAQLTILRLNRASLTGAESDYLEQVEKINKAIDEQNELLNSLSDKQKKAKANVGNYTESVREAIDSSETFKNILGGVNNQSSVFINATRGVVNQLKKIREGFQQAETRGQKFKSILKGGAFAGVALIGAGIGAVASTYRDVSNEIELRTAQLGNVLIAVFTAIANYLKNNLFIQIENIGLKISRFTNPTKWNEYTKAIEKNEKAIASYKDGFSGLFDTILKGNKQIEEQIRLQQQLIDTTNLYQRDISKLNAQIEVQSEIAGDSTRSFAEMNKANEKALKLTEQKIAKEVELAKITKDAVVLEVQRAFLNRSIDLTKQEIESLSFIKQKNTENIIAVELQQKLTDALVNYNEKRGQFAVAEIKSEREKRQIKQDLLEKDLDILIDGFDNQKTINERIIADEKRVFEFRRNKLEETRELADKSYSQQYLTLQQLTSKQIDLNDLVATSDAKVLNEKIRALGVSEIIEGRILEVVRERRTVIQDLADAEKDLNQQEKEKNQRIKESEQAIADARTNLEVDLLNRQIQLEQKIQDSKILQNVDTLKKLETQRADLLQKQAFIEMERQKELARNTIVNQDELNAKVLQLEAEQAEKFYQIERDKNDRIKELNKQQFNNYVEQGNKAVQNLLSSYNDFSNKRDARENSFIDNQITKRQTSIDKQRNLAERGLSNQLAFEEQQLAKSELKKQQLLEQQARKQEAIELTQTYFNFLNARLQRPDANPNTAYIQALGDVALSKGIAKGLVGFYEGTENVANSLQGNKFSEGRDGYVVRVDGSERIMTGEQNKKVGNLDNDSLANIALNYRNGNLLPITQLREVTSNIQKGTAQNMYNSILVQEQYKTNALLEDLLKKPTQQVHVDTFGNLVETIYQQTEKTIITHKMPKRKL